LKTLDQQRESVESLLLAKREAELSLHLRSLEYALTTVQEASYPELVDRREYLTDEPGFYPSGYGERYTTAADREHGSFPPFFENEQDLHAIRGVARFIVGWYEHGAGIVENLTNYVLGNGLSYTASAKSESDKQLAEAAQAILDEWQERVGWTGDLERELFQRGRVDGEWFLAFDSAGGGFGKVRIVEPEWVTQPLQARSLEDYYGLPAYDWHYGVATDIANYEAVHGAYWAPYGDANAWQFTEARDLIHYRGNVPRGVKRGLSDFYQVHQTIERAARLLDNTLQGAAVRAAIAYIVEHAKGTPAAAVQDMTATLADATFNRPKQSGTRSVKVNERLAGTRLDVENGRQFHSGMSGTPEGPAHIEVIQSALRRVGARWCMPEYMVSGDASNANYSSTLVAESPFVKFAEAQQASFARHTRRVMLRVLELAAQAGRLNCHSDDVSRRLKIEAECPTVAVTDRAAQAAIDASLVAEGAMSQRTRRERAGLDPEQELERLAQETPPPQNGAPPTRAGLDSGANADDAPLNESERHELARRLLYEGYP